MAGLQRTLDEVKRFKEKPDQVKALKHAAFCLCLLGRYPQCRAKFASIFDVDPAFDVMRRLDPLEVPPALSTLFGDEDPLDGEIQIGGVPFKVTGILKKVPRNSHLQFEMLVSIASYPQEQFANWRANNLYTYVLLRPTASRPAPSSPPTRRGWWWFAP